MQRSHKNHQHFTFFFSSSLTIMQDSLQQTEDMEQTRVTVRSDGNMMTTTENGAPCFNSAQAPGSEEKHGFITGPFLELDSVSGRGCSYDNLALKLQECWESNPSYTLKLIFKIRDCRGGKGEREVFRKCLRWLEKHHPEDLQHNLAYVPLYGRWDDVLSVKEGATLMGQQLADDLELVSPSASSSSSLPCEVSSASSSSSSSSCSGMSFFKQITNVTSSLMKKISGISSSSSSGNSDKSASGKDEKKKRYNLPRRKTVSLASKWAPSEGKRRDKRYSGAIDEICLALGFHGNQKRKRTLYRKNCLRVLRPHLALTETKMCEGNWHLIDFSRVPSRCMKKCNKAFAAHDASRYANWCKRLNSGDPSVKVNAKQLFVHEIVSQYLKGNNDEPDLLLEAQW